MYCQECGSRYASIGRDYLACSAARGSGTCSNRQSIRRAALEGLIINGLRQRLMAPELVEEFVRAVQIEINLQRRKHDALREVEKRELAEVTRKLDGLIDAIADGLRAPSLQQRLDELEARRRQLEQELATGPLHLSAFIRIWPRSIDAKLSGYRTPSMSQGYGMRPCKSFVAWSSAFRSTRPQMDWRWRSSARSPKWSGSA